MGRTNRSRNLAKAASKWSGELAVKIDRKIEKTITHPLFLSTVSAILNFESRRKLWTRNTLSSALRALELPNKRDQERTLHLINELHHRISKLETELREERIKSSGTEAHARNGRGAKTIKLRSATAVDAAAVQ